MRDERPTEFGGKPRRNTLQRKASEALTAAERWRLIRRTATEDPKALPDPKAFQGQDPNAPPPPASQPGSGYVVPND